MSWMTQFMPTWNPGAPKVVSDGLHSYAAVCCVDTPTSWSVVRRRGSEGWSQAGPTFFSSQPPVIVIDRKGRLHIFSNGPQVRHRRYDHPAINLTQGIELPVAFAAPVAYLHASYDASSDTMMLAFSETSTWTTHVGVAHPDASDWLFTSLPEVDPSTFYLYVRTLRVGGRVLHPRCGASAERAEPPLPGRDAVRERVGSRTVDEPRVVSRHRQQRRRPVSELGPD